MWCGRLTVGSKVDIFVLLHGGEKTDVGRVAGILYLRDGGGLVSICRELLEFKRSFSKSESVRFASMLSVESSVSSHVMIMNPHAWKPTWKFKHMENDEHNCAIYTEEINQTFDFFICCIVPVVMVFAVFRKKFGLMSNPVTRTFGISNPPISCW
jgi:hypothetical protein